MLIWVYDFAFCCKFGKKSQIHVFRGVRPDYYDITWGGYQNLLRYYMGGGLPDLLQYYNGGGGFRDPKFVLLNIWTAPNDNCTLPRSIFISYCQQKFLERIRRNISSKLIVSFFGEVTKNLYSWMLSLEQEPYLKLNT